MKGEKKMTPLSGEIHLARVLVPIDFFNTTRKAQELLAPAKLKTQYSVRESRVSVRTSSIMTRRLAPTECCFQWLFPRGDFAKLSYCVCRQAAARKRAVYL